MSYRTANLSSAVDLRTATDERLPLVLATLGYTQTHTLEDTRLAIGYSIAVVSAVTYYLEKKLDFVDALPYTKILLVLYAVFSAAAWLHSRFVEKGTVYQGYKKGQNGKKQLLEIAGEGEKYTPEYSLTLTLKSEAGAAVTKEATLEFKDVFDKFGNLHDALLAQWFKDQLDEGAKEK